MLDIFLHSSFPGLPLPLVYGLLEDTPVGGLLLISLGDLQLKPLPLQVMKLKPREESDLCKVTQVKGTPAPNPLQASPTMTAGELQVPHLLSHNILYTHTQQKL